MAKRSVPESKTKSRLRALAWVALVCTVVLALIILAEGLTPGDRSSKKSDFVSGIANKIFKRETKTELKRITFRVDSEDDEYYVGDVVYLDVTPYPANATISDIVYSVDQSEVASVNDDILTFVGEGEVTVTATANGGLCATRTYFCFGQKIEYDADKLTVAVSGIAELGKEAPLMVTYDGEDVPTECLNVAYEDGYVKGGALTSYKVGNVEIRVKLGKKVFKKTVCVERGDIVIPESITSDMPKIVLAVGESCSARYNLYPSTSAGHIYIESEDSAIAEPRGSIFYANAVGTTKIKIASAFARDVYFVVDVEVVEQNSEVLGIPNTITVYPNKDYLVGKAQSFSVIADGYRILSRDEFCLKAPRDIIVYGNRALRPTKAGAIKIEIIAFDKTVPYTVVVNENPDLTIHEDIIVKSAVEVNCNDTVKIKPRYADSKMTGEYPNFTFVSSDDGIAVVSEYGIVTGVAQGQCVITVSSPYDASISKNVTVTVEDPVPHEITLSGDDRIAYNSTETYVVQYEREFSRDAVEWEVVSGPARITEDGKLTCLGIGDITIRATSSLNPSLVAEKTVHGVLYKSFSMFIRKFIGHFSAFAVLGMGVVMCCLLMLKRKLHAIWLAPTITLAVAGLSEVFQLPIFTTGRYATLLDVAIDFVGGILGMAIAVALWYALLGVSTAVNGCTYARYKLFSAKDLVRRKDVHE